MLSALCIVWGMIKKAVECKPGQRYVTQKHVVMELADNGKGALKKDTKNKTVLAYQVKDGNTLTGKTFPIPWGYPLKTYDPDAVPESARVWRGWARRHAHFPEEILDTCEGLGCYLTEAANYYAVGKSGTALLAVFRMGRLGFKKYPGDHFKNFSVTRANTRYMPFQIELKDIGNREEALLDEIRSYVSTFDQDEF